MTVELRVPFGTNQNGGIAMVWSATEQAGQHLASALGTTPRERVMRADYGSLLQSYLFAVADDEATHAELANSLSVSAAQQVTDAQVTGIDVVSTGLDGRMEVEVAYVVPSTGESDTVTLTHSALLSGGRVYEQD